MFQDNDVMAMVPVKDLDEAKKFYSETLGLQGKDVMGGLSIKCGAGLMYIYQTPMAGTNKATTATWEVTGIEQIVSDLQAKGIEFIDYQMEGAHIENHVHTYGPAKAAWFTDPSGNILGLSEGPDA